MATRIIGEKLDSFHVKQGVCQGRILSPKLFNIYSEQVKRETLEYFNSGIISIGGR